VQTKKSSTAANMQPLPLTMQSLSLYLILSLSLIFFIFLSPTHTHTLFYLLSLSFFLSLNHTLSLSCIKGTRRIIFCVSRKAAAALAMAADPAQKILKTFVAHAFNIFALSHRPSVSPLHSHNFIFLRER